MKTTLRRQGWVVTDLDGTLMDHRYDCAPALGTIRLLQRRGIPLLLQIWHRNARHTQTPFGVPFPEESNTKNTTNGNVC